jgi:hypothetical protein
MYRLTAALDRLDIAWSARPQLKRWAPTRASRRAPGRRDRPLAAACGSRAVGTA